MNISKAKLKKVYLLISFIFITSFVSLNAASYKFSFIDKESSKRDEQKPMENDSFRIISRLSPFLNSPVGDQGDQKMKDDLEEFKLNDLLEKLEQNFYSYDENNNKKVSMTEFESFIEQMPSPEKLNNNDRPIPEDFEKDNFNQLEDLDLNGDDEITLYEAQENLKNNFNKLDKNGDEKLSKDEFPSIEENQMKRRNF